jgi:hypothetical protein
MSESRWRRVGWTARRAAVIVGLAAVAALVAVGCSPPADAPLKPAPKASGTSDGTLKITAEEPREMAEGVSQTTTFRWRLPAELSAPGSVTFELDDAGRADKPETDAERVKRVAIASQLALPSPTALDPWHLPGGVILTGDLTDMKKLAPQTWYSWKVMVSSTSTTAQGQFYFRTGGDAVSSPVPTPTGAAARPAALTSPVPAIPAPVPMKAVPVGSPAASGTKP